MVLKALKKYIAEELEFGMSDYTLFEDDEEYFTMVDYIADELADDDTLCLALERIIHDYAKGVLRSQGVRIEE